MRFFVYAKSGWADRAMRSNSGPPGEAHPQELTRPSSVGHYLKLTPVRFAHCSHCVAMALAKSGLLSARSFISVRSASMS